MDNLDEGWKEQFRHLLFQLKYPERNGGRELIDLANHLEHDSMLHWAWKPEWNRQPAPYSRQEHVTDILKWGAASMTCPTNWEPTDGQNTFL